jgi:hypothetical protein
MIVNDTLISWAYGMGCVSRKLRNVFAGADKAAGKE